MAFLHPHDDGPTGLLATAKLPLIAMKIMSTHFCKVLYYSMHERAQMQVLLWLISTFHPLETFSECPIEINVIHNAIIASFEWGASKSYRFIVNSIFFPFIFKKFHGDI